MLLRCGTFRLIVSNVIIGSVVPVSLAMADRCSTVFVEPPSAESTAMAFSNAFWVRMFEGVMFCWRSWTICLPVSLAIRSFSALVARVVAQ